MTIDGIKYREYNEQWTSNLNELNGPQNQMMFIYPIDITHLKMVIKLQGTTSFPVIPKSLQLYAQYWWQCFDAHTFHCISLKPKNKPHSLTETVIIQYFSHPNKDTYFGDD